MLKHSSYSYFACNLAWPHNKQHQSLIKLNQFNSGMHIHTRQAEIYSLYIDVARSTMCFAILDIVTQW